MSSVRDVKSSKARHIMKIKYFEDLAVLTQRRARGIIDYSKEFKKLSRTELVSYVGHKVFYFEGRAFLSVNFFFEKRSLLRAIFEWSLSFDRSLELDSFSGGCNNLRYSIFSGKQLFYF